MNQIEQIIEKKIPLDNIDYVFQIRKKDGFINLSVLARVKRKAFWNWFRLKCTQEHIKKTAEYLNKPTQEIIIRSRNKYTWSTLQIALNFGKWLNKDLPVEIEKKVIESQKEFIGDEEWKEKSKIKEIECNVCDTIKSIENFCKNKNLNDGYCRRCKDCDVKYRDQHRQKLATQSRNWYHNNKDHANSVRNKWAKNHKDSTNSNNRFYYHQNNSIKTRGRETPIISVVKELMYNNNNYINASKLAKDNKKRVQNWLPTKGTQTLFEKIAIQTGIEKDKLLDKEHINNKERIYWLHPKIFIEFAKWIGKDVGKDVEEIIKQKEEEEEKISKENDIFDVDNQIVLYNFEEEKLTIIKNECGSPWFIGKQIATILGYKNTRDAIINNIDEEDKIYLEKFMTKEKWDQNKNTLQFQPKKILINESGLYSLILSSTLPKARKFKRWITSEVLPNIRKEGNYKLKKELKLEKDKLKKLEKKYNLTLKRQKRTKYQDKNIIYVVGHSEFINQYKIGITDDLSDRLGTYNTHAPEDYKVLYTKNTLYNEEIEASIKILYAHKLCKNNKEWFEFEDYQELIDIIEFLVNKLEK